MRHKRLTREEKRSKRKKVIISKLCLLLVMTAGYAAFQTNLNITAKGNIKEPSRVIQMWNKYSDEDFHTDYYRENIVSATFLDSSDVPSDAVESWNVSEDKIHGDVIAYVIPNQNDSTKYDLYIGANGGVIANENSGFLFNIFTRLIKVDFNDNFDTSNVTSMNNMFSSWDFRTEEYAGSSLTTIEFGNTFNTSKVTDMTSMFFGTKITTLDLSDFDTSNVIRMEHMFHTCSELTELNLCSFDTQNVVNMDEMFCNTYNLKFIKTGTSWSTANADTTDMFTGSGVSSVITGQC